MNHSYVLAAQNQFGNYPFFSSLDLNDSDYELYNALAIEISKYYNASKENDMQYLQNSLVNFIDDLVSTKDEGLIYLNNDFIDTLAGEGYPVEKLIPFVKRSSKYCIETVLSNSQIEKGEFWQGLISLY